MVLFQDLGAYLDRKVDGNLTPLPPEPPCGVPAVPAPAPPPPPEPNRERKNSFCHQGILVLFQVYKGKVAITGAGVG